MKRFATLFRDWEFLFICLLKVWLLFLGFLLRVSDNAWVMEEMYHKAQGGSDKMSYY